MPKQPLADFIQAVQQKQLLAGSESWRCTFCNSTLRDFRNTSRLGCAYCYGAFEVKIRDLLRGVHGTSKHQGKRYHPPAQAVEEGASVATELRTRLRRAVEQEQFEEAAKLRDQLKVME
jgi:protein arginine kinase activator